ncbi:hypothetical protein [Alkalicoccus daliensis]|uniref:Uncharacterized protein n=1 Tax=Alkalicoccus daliensis TaxID=745820 RepID=A0A1H0F6Q9_9BACI|nr:hypothetical protein [Alkalicoccus daliensis]SDN90232.1 hypothetical protein SAMN04488053_104209 [Alkalicoccus daliensis]
MKQWIPLFAIALLIGGAMFVFQEPSEDPRIAELEAEVERLSEEQETLEAELASYPETYELAQAVHAAEQFVQAESFEEASGFLSARATILRREGRPTGVIQFEDMHMYEWLPPEELHQRFADFQRSHHGLILRYAADVPDVSSHAPFFMDYVMIEEENEWRISRIAFNAAN